MSKFVYILEGHQSVSEFDTREQALEAAKADALDAWGPGNFGPIYTARLAPPVDLLAPLAARIGWNCFEIVSEIAADEIEPEQVIPPLTRDQEQALGQHILNWFRAHPGTLPATGTADLQEHTHTTPAGETK